MTIAGAALVASSSAQSLYDGFDYSGSLSNGASIGGANGGSGDWSGAWTTNVGTWTSTGLTYTTTGGSLQTTGGALQDIDTTTANSNITGSRTYSSSLGADSQTVWFSYLVSFDNAVYQSALFGSNATLPQGGTDGFGTSVGQSNRSQDNELTATASSSDSTNILDVSAGNTHFVLGRVDFSGASDTLNIWWDIDLAETALTIGAADATIVGAFDVSTAAFTFISGQGAVSTIDEVRLGTSFTDVVVVPEPSTFALLAGLLGLGCVISRRK